MKGLFRLTAVMLLLTGSHSFAQKTAGPGAFKPDPLFANHMVLQRDHVIPIYGTAPASEQIEVVLNKMSRRVLTDAKGRWKVYFPGMKFGGPYQIELRSGRYTRIIRDVLIGDVWFCSGQSNMAFPLKMSATGRVTLSRLKPDMPLRLLKFNALAETDNIAWNKSVLDSINNLNYFSGSWQKSDQQAAREFSAVAFYFGAKILAEKHIPIGLIQMAVGGSPLESWLDRSTMEQDSLLHDLPDNWRKSDLIQDWVRGRTDVNLKNAENPAQKHPYAPAYNDEAGIARLVNFPVKGVIWYQGESNTHNAKLFEHEFPLLVKSWRQKWNNNFPFYYVQLSSIDRPEWPAFRDAQRKVGQHIPGVFMAVSSDLGDSLNVHPLRKKEVGERLALLALKNTYHQHIAASGPIAVKAILVQNKIIITFKEAKKLMAGDGSVLRGFELEDRYGNHFSAQAVIFNNKVRLAIPPDILVTRVLYAWQPFTNANLINEAGLPVSTFSILVK